MALFCQWWDMGRRTAELTSLLLETFWLHALGRLWDRQNHLPRNRVLSSCCLHNSFADSGLWVASCGSGQLSLLPLWWRQALLGSFILCLTTSEGFGIFLRTKLQKVTSWCWPGNCCYKRTLHTTNWTPNLYRRSAHRLSTNLRGLLLGAFVFRRS
jgi:hypothetical protein